MSPERWNRIKELFHSALGQEETARRVFLDKVCLNDNELRTEVEALILAHESDPTFLEQPVSCTPQQLGGALGSDPQWRALGEQPAETVPDAPPHLPERIGQYRIKGMIGSGGMGAVFEAIQDNPRRIVAVKLMKHGIASRSTLRRFEYESQILARLRHSGIAQIYEAGTHRDESGTTPFFAMEFIPCARPITTFAREKKLGMRERIKLFVQACEAVHHGHQKGIIHRDLKPSNILVDSSGQVKIIDFGVARCTDSDLAVTTLQTEIGQLIGTLQYMSPEQCEADPHDLDTRSDVYALGVVFYELLTDRLPYDVNNKAIHEATRLVREEQPTKLGTFDKTLRGDVETITLKALHKDRDWRYQTAGELAADVKRYLASEPIEAKRNSGIYLLRMFARRHRVTALVAIAFVMLLVFSSISLSYMYTQQVRLREVAVRREEETQQIAEFQAAQLADVDAHSMGASVREDILNKAEEAMRSAGVSESEIVGRVTDLEQRLAGINFTDVALRSLENNVFKRSAQAIDEQFAEQPLVRARLFQTLAETSTNLGLLDSAMAYQTEALELRKRILGEEHPATLTSLQSMGYVYRLLGRFEEAMHCYRQALEGRRSVLGNEHPDTLRSMESVGYILQWTNQLDESLLYRQEALEGCRRVLGNDHPQTLDTLDAMCSLFMSMKRYGEALAYCQEAMDGKRRVLGSDNYRTMISISNMGAVLKLMGRLEEALAYNQEALAIGRRILGNDHPSTLLSINNMGTMLLSMGRFEGAMLHYREVLDRRRRILGDDHRDTLTSIHNMGYLLESMGRLEEALGYFRQALAGRRRILGDDHGDTQRSKNAIARVLRKMGQADKAGEPSTRGVPATD